MNDSPRPTDEHAQRPRSTGASAVAIGTAIVGGLALISVGATAAIGTTGSILHQVGSPSGDSVQTVDPAGITELSVDANAGQFQLRFADVREAELEITGNNRQDWRMQRSGDELVVRSGGSWFGGGFCLFGCNFGDDQVVLTLPNSLAGKLDADLTLGAGSLTAAGEFRDLDVDVSAGKAVATGLALAGRTSDSTGCRRQALTYRQARSSPSSPAPPRERWISTSAPGLWSSRSPTLRTRWNRRSRPGSWTTACRRDRVQQT